MNKPFFVRQWPGLLILLLAGLLLLAPCTANAAKTEVHVFLAASMTKPAKVLADKFNADNPEMEMLLNIGSSGELLSKIAVSGMGDIFIPASDAFLAQAEEKQVVASSRPFLKQWPVFCLSKSGVATIKTFDDLAKPGLKIVLGNPKTTALGQTWAEIEKLLPIDQAAAIRANMTLEAAQANQIAQYINTDVVDAGLLFDSIAKANNFTYVEIPAEVNIPETSHIAILTTSKLNKAQQDAVANYILNNIQIFINAGYSPAQ